MMSNLINNGVDAVEEKGEKGIVEVSDEVKGEEVEVIVKDNGVGMPKEKVEKINRGEAVGTSKEMGHGVDGADTKGSKRAKRADGSRE
ncbi:MAG: ATP-binding protein [Endomicrobium sp.]|jgi:two-component system sensor histidine kinase YcbA|nr:ATP-binding protein [Endomicrobium sp.]